MLQKELQFTKVCCMLFKDALLFEVVNDILNVFLCLYIREQVE